MCIAASNEEASITGPKAKVIAPAARFNSELSNARVEALIREGIKEFLQIITVGMARPLVKPLTANSRPASRKLWTSGCKI